jgi:hypothetical protein
MAIRTLTLCTLLLVKAIPVSAGTKTDLVVLKNGDRLTCEIKKLNSGILYLSLGYALGTISVNWAEVAELKSGQLFLVKTEDGSLYRGTLSTTVNGASGQMNVEVIESTNQRVYLEQSRVIRIDRTSDAFWQRFNGTLSSGLNYSKGNQATQYNLSSETEYLRERWSARANFYSDLAASHGAPTSTRNQLSFTGRHLLSRPHYFYEGLVSFLQSSEQGIQIQRLVGGGIGWFLKDTNDMSIAVSGGVAWQRTNYDQSAFSLPAQDVGAALALIGTALALIELKLFRFDQSNVNIQTGVFPAFSDPGRVYVTTNVSYFIKLFGKLSWNVNSYGNWDTRPPVHFSGSDYGATSGLSLSFGNR